MWIVDGDKYRVKGTPSLGYEMAKKVYLTQEYMDQDVLVRVYEPSWHRLGVLLGVKADSEDSD